MNEGYIIDQDGHRQPLPAPRNWWHTLATLLRLNPLTAFFEVLFAIVDMDGLTDQQRAQRWWNRVKEEPTPRMHISFEEPIPPMLNPSAPCRPKK